MLRYLTTVIGGSIEAAERFLKGFVYIKKYFSTL